LARLNTGRINNLFDIGVSVNAEDLQRVAQADGGCTSGRRLT